jgi:hypothetical protein
MTTVYAVLKYGVYLRDVSVYSSETNARSAAIAAAIKEPDDYHAFDVVPLLVDGPIGKQGGDAVGSVDRSKARQLEGLE